MRMLRMSRVPPRRTQAAVQCRRVRVPGAAAVLHGCDVSETSARHRFHSAALRRAARPHGSREFASGERGGREGQNKNGWSHRAAHRLRSSAKGSACPELLQCCTDATSLKHRRDTGLTALHFAAQNGHKDVVGLLLEGKAKANARTDPGGHTAPHTGCDPVPKGPCARSCCSIVRMRLL